MGRPPPPSTLGTPRPGRPAHLRTLAVLFGAVTVPVLIVDQLTKLYVSSHFRLYDSLPVIPHWFAITYTLNPGAAFSLFAGLAPGLRSAFLFSLSALAIVVLIWLLAKGEAVSATTVAFALILAGATGNLIDRLARGQVIDFIHVHYYAYSYPIFNVADSAITIGVALIILGRLRAGSPPP